MHQYHGFGLNISSEIAFPELLSQPFSKPDVCITIGVVPDITLEKSFSNHNFRYQVADKELFFEVNETGKYYALNGDTIIIEPRSPEVDERNLRLFVLATVMAGILLQRQCLPLHASAVLHNNKLALVCGSSGAGKSTTLSGLIKKGYNVFSDDIVVLDPLLKANACYPMIKLWEDTQEKLNHDLFDDRSFSIRKGVNKYGIFFHDNFNTGSYHVHQVFILKKGNVAQIESKRLEASAAFAQLSKQTYRPILIHNNALRMLVFNIISGLAKQCVIYEITRPELCEVDDLVQYVEDLLLQ